MRQAITKSIAKSRGINKCKFRFQAITAARVTVASVIEGRAVHDGGPALALAPRRATLPDNHPRATDAAATASAAPAAKRPRIAQECLQELKDLKQLLDAGVLNAEEFAELKARLLRSD